MVNGISVDYCYSDIGCFPLSAEFYHPKHRPFNVKPLHRRHIRTQFELFNRDHPEGFMMLPWNKQNLAQSSFNPKLETKIIVPGWLDNIDRALWVRKMKDALLWLWAPVNIIVVRWTNFTPYTIATANTRVVGAEMANLMKFLDRELGYDPASYHIIGHSLGAHIAGYCGDRVHGLGRITALDPARPFFQHMPKSVRLDRGDAKFVDAIHSDFTPENAILLLMSFGMTTPVGHVDFYPNGPPLFQPGCMRDTLLAARTGIAKGLEHNSLSLAFLESVRYLTACDHQRSHEWFIESITNRECAFVGVRCNEFEGMINGRCTCDDSPGACAIMGIHADQMYLHNAHEELWPVRSGSIDYKLKKPPKGRSRPMDPSQIMLNMMAHYGGSPPMPPLAMHRQPMPPAPLPLSAAGLDMDHLTSSIALNYKLLAQQAAIISQQPAMMMQNHEEPQPEQQHPTKEEIYAHFKQQAEQMHKKGEPKIVVPPSTPPLDYMDAAASTQAGISSAALHTQHTHDGHDADWTFSEHQAVLDDMAFVGYLRAHLLLSQLDSAKGEESRPTSDAQDIQRRQGGAKNGTAQQHNDQTMSKRLADSAGLGHPDQYNGHPVLVSNLKRDIENWYEDNGRWHLRTNNRPQYCSNQYQLLIYLGPLRTTSRRDRLRANLRVSIIGSRGQLLNQRFVPRGATLTSFTMQPFFILLEDSYTLGQIESVALSWELRNEPGPVQSAATFQSSLVQQLDESVAAYKAKQAPWLPEATKYEQTEGFSWRPPRQRRGGQLRESSRLAASAIKWKIGAHHTHKYQSLERRSSPSRSSPIKTSSGQCSAKSIKSCGRDSLRETKHSQKRRHSKFQRRQLSSSDEQVDTGESQLDDLMMSASAESPTSPNSSDYEEELGEQEQELDWLLQLKKASQLHKQQLVASQLVMRQRQSESGQHVSEFRMLNQTYVVASTDSDQQQQQQQQQQNTNGALADDDRGTSDLSAQSSDSNFVPLVEPPPDESASYKPKLDTSSTPAEEDLNDQASGLKLKPRNFNLHLDTNIEDSIVINQVVVSPLQANYGRRGRIAKTFCPPANKRRLTHDQTIRLVASFTSKCHLHHEYIKLQKFQQKQLLMSQLDSY